MQIFSSLREWIAQAAPLADDGVVYLPEHLLTAGTIDWTPLLGPKARFLVQPADAAPRQGYRGWLTVRGLRRIVQGLPAGASDDELLAALAHHLNPAPVPAASGQPWPQLQWPALPDDEARLHWYRACIDAYADAWAGHAAQSQITPVSRAELDALEDRIGCALPPFLRLYHERLGTVRLPERLLSVTADGYGPIEPLIDAYPGIPDILESLADDAYEVEMKNVDQLVAFGDYLGNGNLFCFHRQTGAVWYFDHDTAPMLTPMFDRVQDYLDALMIKCLAEAHEGEGDDTDKAAETLLRERFGAKRVRKWMY